MEENTGLLERHKTLLNKVKDLENIVKEFEVEGGVEKFLEYKQKYFAYKKQFEDCFKSKHLLIYTKLIDSNGNIISTDIKSNVSLKASKLYIEQEIKHNTDALKEEIKSLKQCIEANKEVYLNLFDNNCNLKSDLQEYSHEKEYLLNKIKNLDDGYKLINDLYNKAIEDNLNIIEQNTILKNKIKVDLISRINFLFDKNYFN